MSSTAQLDALVSLITSSVERVKDEYKRLGYDAPDLHSVEPHPLDGSQPSLELKQAMQTIEGACAQLSVLVTPPQHTVTNVRPRPYAALTPPLTMCGLISVASKYESCCSRLRYAANRSFAVL